MDERTAEEKLELETQMKRDEPKRLGKYFNPLSNGKYRNNLCVCGSGKKIKKCHGKEFTVPWDERQKIVRWINEFNVKFQTEFAKEAARLLEEEDERKETEDTGRGTDNTTEETA